MLLMVSRQPIPGNIFITWMVIPAMDVVSIKVDRKTREKMRKMSNVNWSEIIRRALQAKIEEEESRNRSIDRGLLLEAASLTDKMRKRSKGWNSTEEIRKWRQARR